MLAPINLDDQLGLEANEIQNVIPQRVLPAELQIRNLLSAQEVPQSCFGVSHTPAQFPRKLSLQNKVVCLAFHRNPSPPQPSP